MIGVYIFTFLSLYLWFIWWATSEDKDQPVYAQIPIEEWDKLKRLALMLDLGDGGTFTQDELTTLKQVANEWAEHTEKTDFFIHHQIKVNIENDQQETQKLLKTLQENMNRQVGSQPGPVKVSNSVVTVPPIPRGGQGSKL